MPPEETEQDPAEAAIFDIQVKMSEMLRVLEILMTTIVDPSWTMERLRSSGVLDGTSKDMPMLSSINGKLDKIIMNLSSSYGEGEGILPENAPPENAPPENAPPENAPPENAPPEKTSVGGRRRTRKLGRT
jgi:hypothetical protein